MILCDNNYLSYNLHYFNTHNHFSGSLFPNLSLKAREAQKAIKIYS